MQTPYDNDLIQVKTRSRIRGGFGDIVTSTMTVAQARELRNELFGRNYWNTKSGDKIFLGVSGTLSQIYASGGK